MRITLSLCGSPAAIAQFLATVPHDLCDETVPPSVDFIPSAPMAFTATLTPTMPTLTDDSDDSDDAPAAADAPATDSTGLPWDERIHASSKAMVAGNKWRKRKGVSDVTVAAVEAELRGTPAVLPAPIQMPTMQMPSLAPMMPAVEAAVAQTPIMQMPPALTPPPAMQMPPALAPAPEPVASAPVPVMEPIPAPVPEPVAPSGDLDMAGFMAHLTTLMQQGRVTTDDLIAVVGAVNAAFTPHGHAAIAAITDVGSDPQKLAYAVQVLQANAKW